ncbi:FUN14 domain-containing protein [Deinococcus roseus]|uniref:Uncharacterized protein n=1 Tax=Deinococcus roseus TaxID=392414 RepID=A0ABQ2D9F0_9DEIO|nr:FUN14 domain-containing protein [Deinococcus roseus]GGJ48057.1 hypothetical protein GCM10008938_37580 [Deinococcus roseus]
MLTLEQFSALSFSFLMGYASALSLKTISKLAAILLGVIFLMLQWLSWVGVLTINWEKIRDALGMVSAQQLVNTQNLLTAGLPDTASFLLGFFWIWRKKKL